MKVESLIQQNGYVTFHETKNETHTSTQLGQKMSLSALRVSAHRIMSI